MVRSYDGGSQGARTWLSLFLVTVEFSLHLRLNYFAFRWRPLAKVEVVRNVVGKSSYGPILGPPFHLPIFPSLPLRCLSLLLAPLLASTHTSPPSFVSCLPSFWRYRPLGFSFLLCCCFVVCLPVCNSLRVRGRYALAVKSGRGLSP